jgi:hypothetical protein
MSGNHYEMEKEMNRRQCDIERTTREAWKFQGGNGKIITTKRGLRSNPILVGLLQILKK